MEFINWFAGNVLVWVLYLCIVVDAVIFGLLAWMVYQDWRWRK